MKKYYLYYLIDPNDNLVRYIGITNNPKRRFLEHLKSPKYENTHKSNWIAKLISDNQKPLMEIISESTNRDEIFQKEIDAIKQFDNLTNGTCGGDYFTFTPEVIEKIKLHNKGVNNPNYGNKWNDEQKKNQSERYLGRKLTSEWKHNQCLSTKTRIEVTINGITYPSLKNASISLGISQYTAKKIQLEQQNS